MWFVEVGFSGAGYFQTTRAKTFMQSFGFGVVGSGYSHSAMDVTQEQVVPWLALGVSMILCLRVVGTVCPHATLSPFWTCSAQELQDTFELFCEAGVDHLVAVILAENRKGELPWRSLALSFQTLASVLKQELGRLRRSFATEDLARRHERMIVRRFGALTTWCCLPTDMADRVLRLQAALRSAADRDPSSVAAEVPPATKRRFETTVLPEEGLSPLVTQDSPESKRFLGFRFWLCSTRCTPLGFR